MHPKRALLTLLLLAFLLPAAHAQWAWRDQNGRVTASDLPPPREIPEKDIIRRPAGAQRGTTAAGPAVQAPAVSASAVAAPVSAPKPAVDRELEAKKRAADAEQATKAKAEEEKLAVAKAENCKRGRLQLAAMESGQRIARVNEKGEREFLDDNSKAQEARRAREIIASDCR